MSLRYGSTRTIGIVVPDISFSHYAHIVKWIVDEASKNGYLCIVMDSGFYISKGRKWIKKWCLEDKKQLLKAFLTKNMHDIIENFVPLHFNNKGLR